MYVYDGVEYRAEGGLQAQGALFSWTLDSHDARGRQTIDGAAHVGTVALHIAAAWEIARMSCRSQVLRTRRPASIVGGSPTPLPKRASERT